MSDAPERIWVTFGRRGNLEPAINPAERPCPEAASAFPEYVRADRLEAIEAERDEAREFAGEAAADLNAALAENRRLREALQPFARFLDAAELMGGPSRLIKDSDPFYSVESGKVGLRELTLGDLKAARAALSTDEGEARAMQSQTEGNET